MRRRTAKKDEDKKDADDEGRTRKMRTRKKRQKRSDKKDEKKEEKKFKEAGERRHRNCGGSRSAAEDAEGHMVLRGATVVTMKGDEVLKNADIVVEDNRIKSVGAKGSAPAGAKVIDVRGQDHLAWIC